MFGTMTRGGRLVGEPRMDPQVRWALGGVDVGVRHPQAQLAGNGPVRVLLHGEIDNDAVLRAALVNDGVHCADEAASLVAAVYARHKQQVGAMLKGAFAAAIFDEAD